MIESSKSLKNNNKFMNVTFDFSKLESLLDKDLEKGFNYSTRNIEDYSSFSLMFIVRYDPKDLNKIFGELRLYNEDKTPLRGFKYYLDALFNIKKDENTGNESVDIPLNEEQIISTNLYKYCHWLRLECSITRSNSSVSIDIKNFLNKIGGIVNSYCDYLDLEGPSLIYEVENMKK